MRHYEIVFLVHPDRSEQVPAMMTRYREMVESGNGRIHRAEDWGRRRLAYGINDIHKAHYILFNIECSLEVLEEIKRNFKFNDSILRHLVVRRKQAITQDSPFAKAKAEEEKRQAEADMQPAGAIQDDAEAKPQEAAVTEAEAKEESDTPAKDSNVQSTVDGGGE